MALNVHDLDLLAAGGCTSPGCKHDHHGEVFLHGLCHKRSRVKLSLQPGLLLIACVECSRPISAVAIVDDARGISHDCHPQSGLDARYLLHSGNLEVMCHGCQQVVQTFEVSRL